jgi:hypothetical protein
MIAKILLLAASVTAATAESCSYLFELKGGGTRVVTVSCGALSTCRTPEEVVDACSSPGADSSCVCKARHWLVAGMGGGICMDLVRFVAVKPRPHRWHCDRRHRSHRPIHRRLRVLLPPTRKKYDHRHHYRGGTSAAPCLIGARMHVLLTSTSTLPFKLKPALGGRPVSAYLPATRVHSLLGFVRVIWHILTLNRLTLPARAVRVACRLGSSIIVKIVSPNIQ